MALTPYGCPVAVCCAPGHLCLAPHYRNRDRPGETSLRERDDDIVDPLCRMVGVWGRFAAKAFRIDDGDLGFFRLGFRGLNDNVRRFW